MVHVLHVTESEYQLILLALRMAGEQFHADARHCKARILSGHLAEQFDKQAKDVRALLTKLD